MEGDHGNGRGEIEWICFKALNPVTSYSTINLTFFQPIAGHEQPDENPGFLKRTVTAFNGGFDFIKNILIGLVSIWPLLLLVFAGWVLVKKLRYRILATGHKS